MNKLRRKVHGNADSGVPALVEAVKEHKKFRQLAVYSIDTLTKNITPPIVTWRENIDEANRRGACECVVDVLKLHPGNEVVLMTCLNCLAKLAVNGEAATAIAKAGGVEAVLDSLEAGNVDMEIKDKAMELLNAITNHGKILPIVTTAPVVTKVMNVTAAAEDTAFTGKGVRVLEKFSKLDVGCDAIREGGGIDKMNQVLTMVQNSEVRGEEEEQLVVEVNRILQRLCNDPASIQMMKSSGLVEGLLSTLEAFPSNELIEKTVGKTLAKIMSDSIDDLITTLKSPDASESEKQNAMRLLAALALDSSTGGDMIAKRGGVGAIIGAFKNAQNAAAIEQTARAIANLAATRTNIEELVKEGAIPELISMLNSGKGSAKANAAMIDALGRICAIPVHGASVVQAGGIPAVIAAFNRDPDDIGVVHSTAAFMQQVAKTPEGAAELVNNDGIGAIVRMMTKFADNIPVQSRCTTALQQIALAGPGEVSQIIAGGVVPLAVHNLTEHVSNAPLVLESLQLLTTLGHDPAGLAQLKAAGTMDPLVTAVMTHIRDPEIRTVAQELVTLLSDETTCAEAVETLKGLEKQLKDGAMTREDMVAKIPPASMLLGTLALAPENVQHIISHGGLPLLTKLLDGISAMPKFKGQDQVLSTLTMALNELMRNAPPGTDGQGPVLAATKVIRNHPDQINAVVNSLNLLDTLSYIPQNCDTMLENGTVDVVAKLMKENATNLDVAVPATRLLEVVSNEKKRAEQLPKKNATRPIIKAVPKLLPVEEPEAITALRSILATLDNVADTEEGQIALAKQGAVPAIFAAMEAHSDDPQMIKYANQAIAKLVTDDDVIAVLNKLKGYDPAAIPTMSPDKLDKIAKDVHQLGLLLMSGDFANLVEEHGGIPTLTGIMQAAEQHEDCPEKENLMNELVKAFGRAADNIDPQDALPVVPILLNGLQDGDEEMLRAIGNLARDPDTLKALTNAGAVSTLMPLLETNLTEPEALPAILMALAPLADDEDATQQMLDGSILPKLMAALDEALENLDPEGVKRVFAVVSQLVDNLGPTLQNKQHKDDIIKMLNNTVDTMPLMPVDPELLGEIASLMSTLCTDEDNVRDVIDSGFVPKLLDLLDKRPDYLKDPRCMENVAYLFETLAQVDEVPAQLQGLGAPDALIQAMAKNPNDNDLQLACAKALSAISGVDSNITPLIEQLDGMVHELQETENPAIIPQITNLLKPIGNIVALEGDNVDQETADKLMTSVQSALKALEALPVSPDQQDCIAQCLNTLGALAALEHLDFDEDVAVLDVLGAVGDEETASAPHVRKAAMATLGKLAKSPKGVQSIAHNGAIAKLQKAKSPDQVLRPIDADPDEMVAKEAKRAMDVISYQAISCCADLINRPDGIETIAQILMGIDEPETLNAVVAQITQLPDGEGPNALMAILEKMRPEEGPKKAQVVNAIVDALLAHRDLTDELPSVATIPELEALVDACKYNPDAVVLMEKAVENPVNCVTLSDAPGALELIVEGMDSKTPGVQLACMNMLSSLVAQNDPAINARLCEVDLAPAIIKALEQPDAPEDAVQNGLYCLAALADNVGVPAMGLNKDALKTLQDLLNEHNANPYILDTGAPLMAALNEAFAGGAEALLEDRLQQLPGLHEDVGEWVEVVGPDGKVYYTNPKTGAVQWNEPPEHLAFLNELDNVLGLMENLDGDMSDIDPALADGLANIIGERPKDKRVMQKVTEALKCMAHDPANAKQLAQQPKLANLVQAMLLNPDDEGILDNCATTLEAMSKYDQFQEALNTLEYIIVLNNTIQAHMPNEPLVTKAMNILANLAFNNPTNAGYEVQVTVPKTVKECIQEHSVENDKSGLRGPYGEQDCLEACCRDLLNIAAIRNDDYKKLVCDVCADEIIQVLTQYEPDNPNLFNTDVRCQGMLSQLDYCIMPLLTRNSVALVTRGMRKFREKPEVLINAINLYSNFGAMEDSEADAEATAYLIDQEGIIGIHEACQAHDSHVRLLIAAMNALYNIANDTEAAEHIVDILLFDFVIDMIIRLDYERPLVQATVHMLAVLSFYGPCIERFPVVTGCAPIFHACETKMDDEHLIEDAVQVTFNIAVHPDNRTQIVANRGVEVLLKILQTYLHNIGIIKGVVTTFSRLATDHEASRKITEDGMYLFMKAVSYHVEDTELLMYLFELFGQLAFLHENLGKMIQFGAVKVIVDTLKVYKEDGPLMIKTMNTLDNLVAADEEYASVAEDKGALGHLQEIIKYYDAHHDQEIKQVAQTTALTLQTQARVKDKNNMKTHKAFLYARLGKDAVSLERSRGKKKEEWDAEEAIPEGDPLEEFRSPLLQGITVGIWENGARLATKEMKVSQQWDSVLIKDMSAASGMKLPLRTIRTMSSGLGDGHVRKGLFGTVSAEEEQAFTVVGVAGDKVFCEAATAEDRQIWIMAVTKLLEISTRFPMKLKPPKGAAAAPAAGP